MNTPTVSFRIRPDQQPAIREVVHALKRNPELSRSVLTHIRQCRRPGLGEETASNIGPFRDADAALDTLASLLQTSLRPEAVFLFGSRARGTERPDSDFDFLAVLSDDRPRALDYMAAGLPVAGCGVAVDVVPCRHSDFEAGRNQAGTLYHEVHRHGLLLRARIGGPYWERYLEQFPNR